MHKFHPWKALSCLSEKRKSKEMGKSASTFRPQRNLQNSTSDKMCVTRTTFINVGNDWRTNALFGHSILFLVGYLFAVSPTRDRIIVSIDRARSMSTERASHPSRFSSMHCNGSRWNGPDDLRTMSFRLFLFSFAHESLRKLIEIYTYRRLWNKTFEKNTLCVKDIPRKCKFI